MNWNSLTPNEVALISALVSAATALLVWFLTQRFGPNYTKHISDLGSTMTQLLEKHATIADSLTNLSARIEENAARSTSDAVRQWKPNARIETEPGKNFLVLKGHREFMIESVAVLAPNGAVMAEIRKPEFAKISSTGFRIDLPASEITKLWNNSTGPRSGWTTGAINANVIVDTNVVSINVPFMARQDFTTKETQQRHG